LGVISEKTIDEKNGIYAWRGRHQVISEIILKYKYNTQDELYRLYELVADYINPSYEIERTTINELCDPSTGIGRVHDMRRQNILYRKLISASPAQRPPRHRLIRNLIKLEDFDTAANEIRVFERTLRPDAPLIRYKAEIQEERARSTKGLMAEDRVAILNEAGNIISNGLDRWPSDRGLHTANCRIGLEILRYSANWEAFDAAIARLERAEKEYLDPALTRVASKFKSLGESARHPTSA
jgi:hypothetical protein